MALAPRPRLSTDERIVVRDDRGEWEYPAGTINTVHDVLLTLSRLKEPPPRIGTALRIRCAKSYLEDVEIIRRAHHSYDVRVSISHYGAEFKSERGYNRARKIARETLERMRIHARERTQSGTVY